MIAPDVLINGGRNTVIYEKDEVVREHIFKVVREHIFKVVREHIFKLFSTNHSPQSQATSLRELLGRIALKVHLTADFRFQVELLLSEL